MSNDNTLITEIPVLPVRTEAEWQAENPVISAGYGAYSTDTHLMRVGDGSTRWNKLSTFNPASYIGPHAHTHEVGGADPIDIFKYLNTPNGSVLFGTGTNPTARPVSGYTLDMMYLCSTDDEEDQVKAVSTLAEGTKIFNMATAYLWEKNEMGDWDHIDDDPYAYFRRGHFIYNNITRKLYYIQSSSILELIQGDTASVMVHATAGENTPIAVNTTVKLPYTVNTAHTDISYSTTTREFTYQGRQPRIFQVTAKQRFARTSIAESDMNTSHNVVLSIVSSRANPVERIEAYGIMVQGIPWMEIAVTKTMQLNTGDTFCIQAETAKEIRTYATSDDTSSPVDMVSTLDIVSLN